MPDNHIPHQPQRPARPVHPPLRTSLKQWWHRSVRETGWLGRLATDLTDAPSQGWDHMAGWIRATLTAATFAITLLLAVLGITGLASWITTQPGAAPSDLHGLLTTITDPVHGYLQAHSKQLPVTSGGAYALWQATGALGFLFSAVFRLTGARLVWAAWGAATAAMVYTATPEPAQALATGWALLAWAIASTLALRDMTFRPLHITHVHADLQPELHAHLELPERALKQAQARSMWPMN